MRRCTRPCGATANAASTSGGATPGPSAPSTRWTTCQPAARASRAARSGEWQPGSAAVQHRSQLAARTGHMTPTTTRKVGNNSQHNATASVLIGSPTARKKNKVLPTFFFFFQSTNAELCLLAAARNPELFSPICEHWFVLFAQESDLCLETGADHRPGL